MSADHEKIQSEHEKIQSEPLGVSDERKIDPEAENKLNEEYGTELEFLQNNPTIAQKAKYFLGLILPSCFIGLSHCGSSMMNLMGFFIVSRSGDEREISAFGLTVVYNMMTAYILAQPVIELTAIHSSAAFGAKNYHLMKTHFLRGLICFLILILVLFLPAALYSDSVLELIGTDPVISARTRLVLLKLFFFDMVRLLSELLIGYMASQGMETGFGTLTLTTMSLALPTAYYTGIHRQMGIDGLIIGRAVLELSKFSILAFTYCIKIPNNGFNFRQLKMITEGLGNFVTELLQFTVGMYTEYVGYEICCFFVIRLKDPVQIAALTSVSNAAFVISNFGYGFATTIRSRVSFLLGRKELEKGKEFLKLAIFGVVVFTCCFSILLFLFRWAIIDLYCSDNPEIARYFEQLLKLYCITIYYSTFYNIAFSVSRALKQVNLLILLDVCIIIVLQSLVASVALAWFSPSCVTFMAIKDLSIFAVEAAMLVRIHVMDWEKHALAKEETRVLLD